LRLLYGNYELTLDDKNRLLVPSEIRKALDPNTDGDAFFLVTGTNGKLWLYPEKYYESLAGQIRSEMVPEDDLLAFDQANFAMASKVEWDKQGRVLISERILRKAGLNKDVTLLGMRDHVEVWDRAEWEKRAEELDQRRMEIAVRAKQRHMGTDSGTGTGGSARI
jgi:MraZ protein